MTNETSIFFTLSELGVPPKVMRSVIEHYHLPELKFADESPELPITRKKPWIYLHGPPGSGKSTYSGYLMALFILVKCLDIPTRASYNSPYYVRATELLRRMKGDFESGKREGVETFERCLQSKFLVLDDLTSAPSTWELTQLDLLIDTRYGNEAYTIITSNLSVPKLGEVFGSERIKSRIAESSSIKLMRQRKR